MALQSGSGNDNTNLIRSSDIINKYTNDVISIITRDMYHLANIPNLNGYQCIPTELLGDINEIPTPIVGHENSLAISNKNNVLDIYNSLITLTNFLLRCGTFSYIRRRIVSFPGKEDNGKYDSVISKSGKAWFTMEYSKNSTSGYTDNIDHKSDFALSDSNKPYPYFKNTPKHLIAVPTNNVNINMPFTAKSIIDLITACLNNWESSGRPVYNRTDTYCHNSCHSNCHSSCHDSCYNDSCHSCDSGSCEDCHCYGDCYNNMQHASGCHYNIDNWW